MCARVYSAAEDEDEEAAQGCEYVAAHMNVSELRATLPEGDAGTVRTARIIP